MWLKNKSLDKYNQFYNWRVHLKDIVLYNDDLFKEETGTSICRGRAGNITFFVTLGDDYNWCNTYPTCIAN